MDVPYADVRDYLKSYGYRLQKCWPRPAHVFFNPKTGDVITFAVRNRQVKRAVFEKIKKRLEDQSE